ncbi:hypothetical protein VTN96DRAFT_5405 [Rasamsonia emersonii]|uniref:FYVE-type domain-containing protein n=1 Tax=Rasamsonia emersonii (strain ATCC 16479 / CBS 393.64 / IMI 116815) TaxID=1408163 RepID=A0A0F4Z3M5_RASE3|nr:Uncharacterized protein T310_1303 [Rasamsonia emersonii CBS 393.64]KKA24671.1 Uncharacterized protein T310_1303 [Rasamsonia emersonii CBS 393.64]
MATHTTTPTQTITTTTAAGQISVYGHPTPNTSATNTPANNSPTSPRMTTAAGYQLPLQSRQIRPPKTPLYVPAALRPTERPQKPAPPTPPRSVHGSLDSLNECDSSSAAMSRQVTSESTKSAISKLAEDAWMREEHLGEVTGAPKRDHWKADSASQTCDSPTCRAFFGLFLRRHHCRHCGHVFCAAHTPHVVPLDQDARFHPDGTPSRACDLCWQAYQRWEESRAAGISRIQSMLDARKDGTISSDDLKATLSISDTSSQSQTSDSASDNQTLDPVASSVPRDWNWSTF